MKSTLLRIYDKTLADHWVAIYSRQHLVLILAGTAGLVAYIISIFLPPVFEARNTFFVPVNENQVSFAEDSFGRGLSQAPLMPIADKKQASVNLGVLKSRSMMASLHKEFPSWSMDKLRRDIDVTLSSEFMIEVFVRDTDPKIAAAIANRLPEKFREFHENILYKRAKSIGDTLRAERNAIGSSIGDLEEKLARQSTENGFVSPEAEAASMASLIGDLRTDHERGLIELQERVRKLEEIRHQLSSTTLQFRENESLRLSALEEESAIAGIRARLSSLKQRITKYEAIRAELPRKTINTRATNRRLEQLRVRQSQIESDILEAKLQLASTPQLLIQVEIASVPQKPVFPLPILNAVIAALVGLIVGAYYALFLEYLSGHRQQHMVQHADWSVLEDYLDDLTAAPSGELPKSLAPEFEEMRMHNGLIISRRDGDGKGQYIVYDNDGTIIDFSPDYPKAYPLVADVIRRGSNIRDILRTTAIRGGLAIPPDELDEWIEKKAHERLGDIVDEAGNDGVATSKIVASMGSSTLGKAHD